MNKSSILSGDIRHKQTHRDEIADDIKRFEEAGGRVELLPFGELTTQPARSRSQIFVEKKK